MNKFRSFATQPTFQMFDYEDLLDGYNSEQTSQIKMERHDYYNVCYVESVSVYPPDSV